MEFLELCYTYVYMDFLNFCFESKVLGFTFCALYVHRYTVSLDSFESSFSVESEQGPSRVVKGLWFIYFCQVST